mgnify:CR=1 FL=1
MVAVRLPVEIARYGKVWFAHEDCSNRSIWDYSSQALKSRSCRTSYQGSVVESRGCSTELRDVAYARRFLTNLL